MVRKHYELDDSLGEFIPYRPNSMSHLKFTKEYDPESITKFHNQIISLMAKVPRKRTRNRPPKVDPPLESENQINRGLVANSPMPVQEASYRTINIPRQIIRSITELHYSDGTIEKEDRTHVVMASQKVYF